MEFTIVEKPKHFLLFGKSSAVENHAYGQVGIKLMDELWKIVKQASAANTGINHWVYLPNGRMFTGVELLSPTTVPEGLERLEFEIPRYLTHLHVGPYQNLPEKWQMLKEKLAAQNETMGPHSLEVYGHHCDDPNKLETTIVIGLLPKH